MATRILLTVSALAYAGLGILLTFLPDEIASQLGDPPDPIASTGYQLLGAVYLGFAALNWLSRRSKIGGIFGRPLVFANFIHVFVGLFAAGRVAIHTGMISLWIATVFYSLLAAAFGYLLLRQA